MRSLGVAILALLVLAVAGCGSSSSKSAATGTSKSPIVVGTVNDVTGAQAAVFGSTNKTMQAWADWTNASGGINGHPVKVIAMDDQFNPTTALTEVKQLVEQDHVVAIVGEQSSYDSNFMAYLQQQGVPLIGDGLFNTVAYSFTDAFPEGTTNLAETYNMADLGAKQGFTKMAVLYCAEAPACAESTPLLQKDTPNMGVNLVYSASVSASAPDYTAQCLGAKNAGAQYVFIADATPVTLRIAQACQEQGLNIPQVATGLSVTAQLANPVENGFMGDEPVMPYFNTASPAIQTMDAALNKYAPGVVNGTSWGMSESYAWASGLLFTDAAKAGHLGDNPTSAQVVAGLESLHDDTLGGMSPPLTFAKGQDHHVSCSFVLGIKDGSLYMPQGSTLICAPPAFS